MPAPFTPRTRRPLHLATDPPCLPQLILSVIILALSIHLDNLYVTNYYPKHGMPASSRYGAWSGSYGILIASIGMLLTIVGRAHAILMICLDVLAAVSFLVCGFVSTRKIERVGSNADEWAGSGATPSEL